MAIETQQPRQMEQHQQQEQSQKNNQTIDNKQCHFFLGDTETGKKILQIFEGTYYSVFISIITLITLFADDFRVIFFTYEDDLDFTIVTLICMGFFFIELTVFSLLKQNYFLKYYFWLDLISTLTMILDLIWITQLLTGGSGVQTAASVAKVARASRASKIGAKATKLIRIIRLIRFLKLYKTASNQLAKQGIKQQHSSSKRILQLESKNSKMSDGNIGRSPNKRWTRIKQASCINISPNHQVSLMNLPNQTSNWKIAVRNQDSIVESIHKIQHQARKRQTQNLKDLSGFQNCFREFQKPGTKAETSVQNIQAGTSSEIQVPTETKVGETLKDQIQKNLITMILIILISIPIFNASTWFDNTITTYKKGIQQLEDAAALSSSVFDVQAPFFISHVMGLPQKLVYFHVQVNSTCCTFPNDYPTEQALYSVTPSTQYRTEDLTAYESAGGSAIIFQSTTVATLNSQLNIGRTLFVCVLLIISTLLFSRDVEIYALEPLENMFDTVKKIALNPLNAIREIQEKNMCIEAVEEQENQQKQEQTQPNMLENLIVKIGGLLAVGFGQAGTQIISRVIQDPNFVNVVIPGEKCMAIFGFCDIRNFTDATQILQADVMVFVNEIAEICHKVTNSHGGSPNKNIGDAFLLVWKYSQGDTKFQQNGKNGKEIQLAETKKVKQLADLAVLSFVKMIAEMAKSHTLLKYKNNKALKNRIPNYKGVKMGFGLHVGWAIEGPIGSQYKIDASYLSPSVNMAGRLEAATKQYGVPMLITGQIYNLMTDNRQYLRHIDRVMFEGYDNATDLYTVDLHIDTLIKHTKRKKQVELTKKEKKYDKVRQNIKRNKLLQDIETKFVTRQMWQCNDIQLMRQKYTRLFYEQWDRGFKNYVKGDWSSALESFKKTQIMAPDHTDGPSETLIAYIQSKEGKAPQNWKGYRNVSF